ncbi:MAG: hypothetical protein A2928_01470 [Candidatus Taylorbacteria bacterium RIFCSPLOWO2_01_FULL_45_15b]|uniref:Uncharacterized protein n=1 Tax=Candidatus Taylorbacteria bacterium RIFCSPLOWO2_01_FULL_45_15b TaxID=1802319 RepID=A0A1G2NHH7_9BACT|nr:MAG: hypothetical protein A2928_01470 [Candidatus Taylorbacteria bacterium RIFCSPLOWO2_01_FULL_45_15b]
MIKDLLGRLAGFVFSKLICKKYLFYFGLRRFSTAALNNFLAIQYSHYQEMWKKGGLNAYLSDLCEFILIKRLIDYAKHGRPINEILRTFSLRPRCFYPNIDGLYSRFAKAVASANLEAEGFSISDRVRIVLLFYCGRWEDINDMIEAILKTCNKSQFAVLGKDEIEKLLDLALNISPSLQEVLVRRAIDIGIGNLSSSAVRTCESISPKLMASAGYVLPEEKVTDAGSKT